MVSSPPGQDSFKCCRYGLPRRNTRTPPVPISSLHSGPQSQITFRSLKILRTVLSDCLHHFSSCFISRLTLEIRQEVQAFQPLTLVQAAGLARLQDEKFLKARARPPSTLVVPPPRPLSAIATPLLPGLATTPTSVSLKRLSPKELASCREHGLCFNCDE